MSDHLTLTGWQEVTQHMVFRFSRKAADRAATSRVFVVYSTGALLKDPELRVIGSFTEADFLFISYFEQFFNRFCRVEKRITIFFL